MPNKELVVMAGVSILKNAIFVSSLIGMSVFAIISHFIGLNFVSFFFGVLVCVAMTETCMTIFNWAIGLNAGEDE